MMQYRVNIYSHHMSLHQLQWSLSGKFALFSLLHICFMLFDKTSSAIVNLLVL